ncbi:MAG: hypothetical protein O3C21_09025 [Verrucomicrobia bacterium]|nr:hypothetical protein [Verrucomicrobiota bacterium]
MTSTHISAIFFIVGVVAVAPVLYYHWRKNPHPRLRPPIGEMVMLTLFALMFVGGGSYFMGTLLSSNVDFSKEALKKPTTNRAQPQDDSAQGGGSKPKKADKTPFGF